MRLLNDQYAGSVQYTGCWRINLPVYLLRLPVVIVNVIIIVISSISISISISVDTMSPDQHA